MLDHINIPVSVLERSRVFYRTILEPLGLRELLKNLDAIGFGHSTWEFGIFGASSGINPLHIAFVAPDRAAVEQFYKAALDAGATDNGPPGIRQEYGESYYAAYVYDFDHHNIEAVCRAG